MADLSPSSFWILTALAYDRSHKNALATTVTDLSRGELRVPPLLMTSLLNELEHAGLIRHDGDEPVNGRFLRYLTLTPRGMTALRSHVEALEYRAATARTALPTTGGSKRRNPRN